MKNYDLLKPQLDGAEIVTIVLCILCIGVMFIPWVLITFDNEQLSSWKPIDEMGNEGVILTAAICLVGVVVSLFSRFTWHSVCLIPILVLLISMAIDESERAHEMILDLTANYPTHINSISTTSGPSRSVQTTYYNYSESSIGIALGFGLGLALLIIDVYRWYEDMERIIKQKDQNLLLHGVLGGIGLVIAVVLFCIYYDFIGRAFDYGSDISDTLTYIINLSEGFTDIIWLILMLVAAFMAINHLLGCLLVVIVNKKHQ